MTDQTQAQTQTQTQEQASQENAGNRDFESEAREWGWVPKEEFHEDPEKWIPAEEFVKRGESVLPILRANNRKLRQDVLTKDAAIATLQKSLANQEKAIKALQEGYSEATKREVEKARADLREQLKEAKKAGDVDTEVEVQERLDKLKEQEQASKEGAKADNQEDNKGKFHPDFTAWNKQNPWFGDDSSYDNRRKTRELIKIGEELRTRGELSAGFEFMDKCMEVLEERESKRQTTSVKPASKVEGGSSRGTAKGGRAFDRLPKEAKDACHADTETFVGPGKQFKTESEWEDHYANLYGED